jgi:hypothetical protein
LTAALWTRYNFLAKTFYEKPKACLGITMRLHSAVPTCLRRAALLWLLVLVCFPAMSAVAQTQSTGGLSGTVRDSGHGLVPGAVVTLTSEERGTVLQSKTNDTGGYVFNDLAVGAYTLKITSPGFSTYISHHVTIDSDTRFRVDAELKPGEVSAEVEVNADGVAVDTQSGTISQVIDNQLVENLPIDGNNIVALAAILPGVTDVSAPSTFTDENGGATLVANGARTNSNLFLFDGFLWNNLFLNTGINYPNHAVIAQVSVQLNNFSAQYGRNAGSIFNVVSKGGSNKIHGQAFLHYIDSAFNAKDYFSGTKPPQRTFQLGLAVGGPIRRDKLFFELEYQNLNGYSTNAGNAETFSLAERGLNPDGSPRPCISPAFVALGGPCASFAADARTASAVSTLVYNPIVGTSTSSFGTQPNVAISQLQSTWLATGHTGTNPCITALLGIAQSYLPNAEVPAVCFDPTIQNVITHGYIPVPTTSLGTSQFPYSTAQVKRPQAENGGFLRTDWVVTPQHSVELRYYQTDNSDFTANGAGNLDTGVPTYGVDANAAYITAGSVGETFIISPNLINVAKVGYKRYAYEVIPTDTTTLGGLGARYNYPGFQSLPVINVNTRFTLGNAAAAYTHSVNQNIEAFDNVSYAHGKHNVQFGTDYLRLQYLNIRANPGRFNFYGNPGFTNVQASDAIMGLLYSETVGNQSNIASIQHALYSYIQDTWRLTPRLTVNLGFRYELPGMWFQPNGKAATFIRGYQSTVFPNAPAGEAFVGDAGVPRGLVPTDYSNASPRVGLAYDVFGNGKTAIRAGFGTFYDAIPATIVGATQPYTYSAFYQYPAGSVTDPLLGEPAIPAPSNANSGSAMFSQPYSMIYADRNFRNAYTIGVNFGMQQQVNKGGILEANYIGRFGRHLMVPLDQNEAIVDCTGAYFQANPDLYCHNGNFGSLLTTSAPYGYANRVRFPGYNYGGQGVVALMSIATANYNAFQINYRQRSFMNVTLLTNYTYSRTLDEQSTLSTSNSTPTPDNLALQYGPSDSNSTHIFNLGFTLRSPKMRAGSQLLRVALRDWNFNGIYNARSGHPVNLTFGGDESGSDEPNQRPYLIPGMSATLPSNRSRTEKIQAWFNAAAFQKPVAGTLGNVGRNSIIGPGYISANLAVMREVSLAHYREGMRAQFRAESFNLFNTVNLAQPRATYSSTSAQASTFGSINAGGANSNRRIQFGAILYF